MKLSHYQALVLNPRLRFVWDHIRDSDDPEYKRAIDLLALVSNGAAGRLIDEGELNRALHVCNVKNWRYNPPDYGHSPAPSKGMIGGAYDDVSPRSHSRIGVVRASLVSTRKVHYKRWSNL